MRRIRVVACAGALALVITGVVVPASGSAYAANSGGTQQMHRLYNRISHEHLYTADAHERDVLSQGDWTYEGVGWVAPVKSSTPVYRLYNPILGDHHYTTDTNEVSVLTRYHNWRNEGIGWYSSDSKEVEVYRQFNPSLRVGSHNYTADLNEYKVNNANNGWSGEGIAWFALEEGWQKGQDPIYATPAAVVFTDPAGTAGDTVTIPAQEGVYYTIDGVRVSPGTYRISGYSNHQRYVSVHAYAEGRTRLATSDVIYLHTYTDGMWEVAHRLFTAQEGYYGNYPAEQAQQIVQNYHSYLRSVIASGSDYSARTSIWEVYGIRPSLQDDWSFAPESYDDASKELAHRYAVRYAERLAEFRAQLGLPAVPLMRVTEAQEATMWNHAVHTMARSEETGTFGHYIYDDTAFQSLFYSTYSRGATGYVGSNGWGENIATLLRPDRSMDYTPEWMADMSLWLYLSEYPYLLWNDEQLASSGQQNGHLKLLMADDLAVHEPMMYAHLLFNYSANVVPHVYLFSMDEFGTAD